MSDFKEIVFQDRGQAWTCLEKVLTLTLALERWLVLCWFGNLFQLLQKMPLKFIKIPLVHMVFSICQFNFQDQEFDFYRKFF